MVRRRTRIHMEALPEDYDRVPGDRRTRSRSSTTRAWVLTCRPRWTRWRRSSAPRVVLCDIEGLSYEEIGATLGVKLGTVRSRIHRGRQALRDHLAAHGVHAAAAAFA